MPKLIQIDETVTACRDCVHAAPLRGSNVDTMCRKAGKMLPKSAIPDWCPLPDAPVGEDSLECIYCPWKGLEREAEGNAAGVAGYRCPQCGEECAHTPLDEITEQITDTARMDALERLHDDSPWPEHDEDGKVWVTGTQSGIKWVHLDYKTFRTLRDAIDARLKEEQG